MFYLTISIIGLPNTGKSSLFNYLSGQNFSTIENRFLTTRDRIYGFFKLNNYVIKLIDTPSIFFSSDNKISNDVFIHCKTAIRESNIVLIVVNAENFSNDDIEMSNFCCKFNKIVILVINKIDKCKYNIHNISLKYTKSFIKHYVSIKQGKGVDSLLNTIYKLCIKDKEECTITSKNSIKYKHLKKVAIIGQSNVGKSTFLNTLFGKNRHLTNNNYFTTADPILTMSIYNNFKILFTDTAGIKVSSNNKNILEYMFINFSMQSIEIADMIIFMTDIYNAISRKDRKIISLVNKSYKPFLIVVNKIDLLQNQNKFVDHILSKYIKIVKTKIIFISSINKKNVFTVMASLISAFKKNIIKINFKKLNHILTRILIKNLHPLINQKTLKIYFGKQISVSPLTIAIYTNVFQYQIKKTYQKHIEGIIKRNFNIVEKPIKIIFFRKCI